MNMKTRVNPTRRSVLAAAPVAILGVPCLSIGLGDAIAEAAATGKPVLTEQSFNLLVEQLSKSDNGRAMAGGMRRDFRGFVESHFSLTPVQRRRLQLIPQSAMSQLQSEFDRVATQGGTMRISFAETPPSPMAAAKGLPKKITMQFSAGGQQTTVAWQTE